jgi:hypothetical protein
MLLSSSRDRHLYQLLPEPGSEKKEEEASFLLQFPSPDSCWFSINNVRTVLSVKKNTCKKTRSS